MMACLNPCDAQMDENLSTLSYASKASFISNKPVKNEDPKTQQIADLKKKKPEKGGMFGKKPQEKKKEDSKPVESFAQ